MRRGWMMFLGIFEMGGTLNTTIQLKNGNSPVTPDAQATFRIYQGTTWIGSFTGTASNAVDSQTGWVNINRALTVGNGFSVGRYTVRVAYLVSAVSKVQDYSFQIA